MTDLGGGVYVSRVDTDEFDADEEVGGFTHTLFEDGEAATAGLWKPGSDVGDWPKTGELPARETIVVLSGLRADRDRGRPDARPPSRRHGVNAQGSGDDVAPVRGLRGDLVLLVGPGHDCKVWIVATSTKPRRRRIGAEDLSWA